MVLQLNPLLPVVWRSPDTIQVGVDRPVVVVSGVTPGLEAVLWALRSGLPRAGAILIGTEAGASVAAVEHLIDELDPALRYFVPRTDTLAAGARPGAVLVDGTGPTAERLRALLRDLGIRVVGAPTDDVPAANVPTTDVREPALAVLIGHYVLDPARHLHWLRRDVPQLPVVFGDAEVRIGPLVEPGLGPCLVCVELHRVDDDAAWPALAAQLLKHRAETETPALAAEVAARAALLVLSRLNTGTCDLADAPTPPETSFESCSLGIDAVTGFVTRRAHRPHVRCGCRSLSEIESAPDRSAVAVRASTS